MANRTRILITHHIGLCISEASYVVHLENGRIHLIGSPSELRVKGTLELILDETMGSSVYEAEKEDVEKVDEIDRTLAVGNSSSTLRVVDDKKAPKTLIKDESKLI